MYEYHFEQVDYSVFGKARRDYREIVPALAAEGWRLAHVFSVTPEGGYILHLIFERPTSGPQDATRADYQTPANYQAPPNF